MSTCDRCLSAQHVRCEDRVTCSCDVCAARVRAKADFVFAKPKVAVIADEPRRRQPKTRPKPSSPRERGRPSLVSKWTPAQVAVFRAGAEGLSISELARRHGLDRRTVRKLLGQEVVRAYQREGVG